MEFLELGFDDFRDCRDIEVIVCRVVGDIPGSVENGAKDFGLETGCIGCWLAWLNYNSMPLVYVCFKMVLYIISLLGRESF